LRLRPSVHPFSLSRNGRHAAAGQTVSDTHGRWRCAARNTGSTDDACRCPCLPTNAKPGRHSARPAPLPSLPIPLLRVPIGGSWSWFEAGQRHER
jgi:hypothetical protein